MAQAIEQVARHRSATLRPLADVLDGFAELGQTRWSAWRRRINADQLPEQFGPVLQAVIDFADPVLTGAVSDTSWNHEAETWE